MANNSEPLTPPIASSEDAVLSGLAIENPSVDPPPLQPPRPNSLPYSEEFENDLMNLILHPDSPISKPAVERAVDAEFPVPLYSPARTVGTGGVLHPELPIPLTHMGGWWTGGPGPGTSSAGPAADAPPPPSQEEVDAQRAFVNDFIQTNLPRLNARTTPATVEGKIAEEVERLVSDVKERMHRREEAVKNNERVEKELEMLKLQRETEKRVWERMRGAKGGG